MVVFLVTIFAAPLFAALAGLSAAKTEMLGALFLPVLIGWSWGRDVSSGRLVPLALAGAGATMLLFVRLAAFAITALLGVVTVALAARTSASEMSLMTLFTAHILVLGFLLVTLFRSGDAGWVPLFVAFAGVWLPLVYAMKQTGGAVEQVWLRWLTAAFLPQFALDLRIYSVEHLQVLLAALSLLWLALISVAARRASALDRRSDD